MNWDSAFENFKNYLKLERGLSNNSIKSYNHDLVLFKKFLNTNKINVTPISCKGENIKSYLYKNLSKKNSRSQARSISAIKSFFNYLIFEGHIKESPISNIEAPKIERKLPKILTLDQINQLIKSVDLNHQFGQRNKTIIEVLYGTGIRVSELINLKLSNILSLIHISEPTRR